MPGQMFVFPTSRHKRIVASIVGGMLKQPSADDAEEFLIDHMNTEWSRLSRLGISDDEKDRQCRGFARVAWRAFYQDDQGHTDTQGAS